MGFGMKADVAAEARGSGGAKDEIMKTRKGKGIERRQTGTHHRGEGGMALAAAGAGAVILAHWQPAAARSQAVRDMHARRSSTKEGREQTGERKTMICSPISSRTRAHYFALFVLGSSSFCMASTPKLPLAKLSLSHLEDEVTRPDLSILRRTRILESR